MYEKFVKPAMIDWPKAAAHYAISSLFQEYGKATRIFSFTFEDEQRELHRHRQNETGDRPRANHFGNHA